LQITDESIISVKLITKYPCMRNLSPNNTAIIIRDSRGRINMIDTIEEGSSPFSLTNRFAFVQNI
jgi:hypothetical protein